MKNRQALVIDMLLRQAQAPGFTTTPSIEDLGDDERLCLLSIVADEPSELTPERHEAALLSLVEKGLVELSIP